MYLTTSTMEIEAIRLDRGPEGAQGNRVPDFGAIIARRGVAPKGDNLLAYQIASTAAPCLPLGAGQAPDASAPLTVFHPRLGKVAEFKLDASTFEHPGAQVRLCRSLDGPFASRLLLHHR